MGRVVTDPAAVAALAFSPEVAATSLRAATAGKEGAARRARVDTGAMRDSMEAFSIDGGGARWGSSNDHIIYNEYGTMRMSAQPMVRPSVADVAAAL